MSFISFGLVSIITALTVNFPASWVARFITPPAISSNLTYSGTIWKGTVIGIENVPSLEYKTSLMGLLSDDALISLKSKSPTLSLSAQVNPKEISDVKITAQTAHLSALDRRLKSLNGSVDLALDKAIFDTSCEYAKGVASTDILSENSAIWQWRGPTLSGPVSCESGDFVVNLTGKDTNQTIQADIRVKINGQYQSTITVNTRDPRAGAVLGLYGFQASANGYRLSETGRWR